MKILFLGECSNLHNTLARGLRSKGHYVTTISDGSGWMNNDRDIDITRKSNGLIDTILYVCKIIRHIPNMCGYDVVQIKHPCFFDLKIRWNKSLFRIIRRYNKKVFLGAFNTDYFYLRTCFDKKTFEYSDYFIKDERIDLGISELDTDFWLSEKAKNYSYYVAKSCDGIIACLYEYYISYKPEFEDKLIYIPLPIDFTDIPEAKIREVMNPEPIRFFIGIQTHRNKLKGTDVMYRALLRLKSDYPDECQIVYTESTPYHEYKIMQQTSHVILDQLYSYTPGMNGVLGLAQGLVVVGGGEEEMYQLKKESKLRPIVNVKPSEDSVYNALKQLILHPDQIRKLSGEAILYAKKYHDHTIVVQSYLNFWKQF